MAEPFDCMIRGGRVVTASGTFDADVAISGETIAAIGRGLGEARRVIDATDKLVLPGGVDPHCHIEQMTAAGVVNADTFATATTSALFGGTTTVIPFAAQHVGASLKGTVADYHRLAEKGAVVDYALHMILADPTPEVIAEELPALVAAGHSSIKLFMTYDRLKVDDERFLDVLLAARKAGALVCVHAENHGMIAWMGKRLVERGYIKPKYHAMAHPRLAEVEAFGRLIAMARLVDQPVMIFHVSTAEGAAVIRQARGEGTKIFAETCPHYLLLDASALDKPGTEGAKWMCSPPMRTQGDSEALWQAIGLGDLQVVSSDHAPFRHDETGKLKAGPGANFKQMANGMPGLENRLPILFDAMVSQGRFTLEKFVEVTATAPARIYNLHPRKGTIQPGADADIAIWDPERAVTLADADVHDATGYTPYPGRVVRGWPETVLVRGTVAITGDKLQIAPGFGRFLPRSGGEAARPTGRLEAELDPARNFGAELL
ncbi:MULTISPECIES: dihydropyrimidinase [unclassified Chelatococcus]|uniref:dihydropyrimidinase n=1 Tax=unclassified Chelatococcus TaxID=2638111 RepID=UPI001BCFDA9E|nr:dihydropyrimidinase [Chelatococcus sp.]MBS7742753.1 dihydropyrimidinase [Chelatococcus sp. HY11]CAH1654695.1 D-hydantoinase [Hyphomicrobiales bacterium]MBX3542129.1 dihydropyrimidinase [Chelatococcus sp.]MCO5075656.1 dihydropyrimidinase [Chelatococcus sp.]CAH1695020.1 D-hydantoinase [Hyphomicrobiales bacterium]